MAPTRRGAGRFRSAGRGGPLNAAQLADLLGPIAVSTDRTSSLQVWCGFLWGTANLFDDWSVLYSDG